MSTEREILEELSDTFANALNEISATIECSESDPAVMLRMLGDIAATAQRAIATGGLALMQAAL